MERKFFSFIILLICIQSNLFSQTFTGTKYPILKGGPYDRVYYPENQPDKKPFRTFCFVRSENGKFVPNKLMGVEMAYLQTLFSYLRKERKYSVSSSGL